MPTKYRGMSVWQPDREERPNDSGLEGCEMTQYEGGRPESSPRARDVGTAWAMVGVIFLVAMVVSVFTG